MVKIKGDTTISFKSDQFQSKSVESSRGNLIAHMGELCDRMLLSRGEVAGLLYPNGRIIQFENQSDSPTDEFIFSEEDEEKLGPDLMLWHSHTKSHQVHLSVDDVKVARGKGCDIFMFNTASRNWEVYFPGEFLPLVGRRFHPAYAHCWDVVRDYYHWELGIKLPYQYRRTIDEHTQPGFDRYRQGLLNDPESRFYELDRDDVSLDDLLVGDVLLICYGCPSPSHVAVYVGEGLMLHHFDNASSRLSKVKLYKNTIDSLWRWKPE